MASIADEAVAKLYRTEWGRIVAALIRLVGDFEIAQEAAREGFAAALALNRAVALAIVRGPSAGLEAIGGLADQSDHYHMLYAARADLLRAPRARLSPRSGSGGQRQRAALPGAPPARNGRSFVG